MGHDFRDWIIHSSDFLCEIHSQIFLFILFLNLFCSPDPCLCVYTWIKQPAILARFLSLHFSPKLPLELESTTCHLMDDSQHLKFYMSRACTDQNLFLFSILLHSSNNCLKIYWMTNICQVWGFDDKLGVPSPQDI